MHVNQMFFSNFFFFKLKFEKNYFFVRKGGKKTFGEKVENLRQV